MATYKECDRCGKNSKVTNSTLDIQFIALDIETETRYSVNSNQQLPGGVDLCRLDRIALAAWLKGSDLAVNANVRDGAADGK